MFVPVVVVLLLLLLLVVVVEVVFPVVVVVLVAVVLVLVVVVRTRLFHARDRCRSCQIQAVHAHRSTCHSRPGVLRSHQTDCVISD